MVGSREALLTKIMDDVAAHGIGGRSLRELATAVGSSHRMLLYHFGTRAGLLAAIVSAMEDRQRRLLRQVSSDAKNEADMLWATWRSVSDPSVQPFVRLFFEVLAIAAQGQPGTEGFLETLVEPWLQLGRESASGFADGARPDDIDLRLDIAVIRGLLLDLQASGDMEASVAALERYIASLPKARRA